MDVCRRTLTRCQRMAISSSVQSQINVSYDIRSFSPQQTAIYRLERQPGLLEDPLLFLRGRNLGSGRCVMGCNQVHLQDTRGGTVSWMPSLNRPPAPFPPTPHLFLRTPSSTSWPASLTYLTSHLAAGMQLQHVYKKLQILF